jgi:hypothetical protein
VTGAEPDLADMTGCDLVRAAGAMGTLQLTLPDDVMRVSLPILRDHLTGEAGRRGRDAVAASAGGMT